MLAETTEVARIDSRGSKGGMFSKTCCPVLETRLRGWGDHRLLRIRKRKRSRPYRESEGFIVPLESEGQHHPGRGKGSCLVRATEERRIRGLPCCSPPRTRSGRYRGSCMPRPSKKPSIVMRSMVECTGATSSAALVNAGRANAHALV